MLSVLVNPQAANEASTISADYDPVTHIKLSGVRTDYEGYIDYQTRLSSYTVGALKTRSGNQHIGNQVPEVRFRVGDAYLRESAKHCNFAGTDCWYVKTHPMISKVSAADGYTTGGQTLTIDGWGLKGDALANVTVTVDGVDCKVTESTLEQIKCVTGAATTVSTTSVSQPGSPGFTQKIYDSTNDSQNPYWGMFTDGNIPVTETKLLTGFENTFNNYTRAGTNTKGWFKAPAAGNYRFYISCDDNCQFWMD